MPLVVQEIDLKNKKVKGRYRKRHLIEEEYKMRNNYDEIKKEELSKNRIHNGRLLESKAREFNILNAHNYDSARTEKMFGKKLD